LHIVRARPFAFTDKKAGRTFFHLFSLFSLGDSDVNSQDPRNFHPLPISTPSDFIPQVVSNNENVAC
jgi:hypothetical protein